MVHVRVGEEDGVDLGQLADAEAGAALAAEQDEARREDGVDEQAEVGGLDEEGGVADEGDGGFAGAHQGRELWSAGEWRCVAFAYQAGELLELGDAGGVGGRHGDWMRAGEVGTFGEAGWSEGILYGSERWAGELRFCGGSKKQIP